MQRGAIGNEQTCPHIKGHFGGHTQTVVRGDRDVFGHPADRTMSDHAIAEVPTRDAFTECIDGACDLEARREGARGFKLIFIFDDERIGIIDATGRNGDADLIGLGLGGCDLIEPQGVRSARSVAQ